MSISRRSLLSRTAYSGLLCLILVALTACIRPTEIARIPADPIAAKETWTRFINTSARTEAASGPFRLNGTLYYSGNEESQRVLVYFWGNGDKETPLPLRLDILMGQGSVMAAVNEVSHGLFIHVPRDETVYYTEDNNLLAFDVPVPFSLADLAMLVTGRYALLFASPDLEIAPPFHNAAQGEDGTILYTVADVPLAGKISLDSNGLPLFWTDGKDWTLTIEYWPDSTRPTPRKLHMQHAKGRQATLIVRTLDHTAPFTPKQLQLPVPSQTPLAPLAARQ